MRPRKPGRGTPRHSHDPAPRQSAVERAGELLQRVEAGGPNPATAAEELDRMQGRLRRDEALAPIARRVEALCREWSGGEIRGEAAKAWLTLVGAFGLREHAPRVAAIAADAVLPVSLREQALRVLSSLRALDTAAALLSILESRTDARVRAAAAEALAELGDRSARARLEPLLEEELPRPVWTAVAAALDRLR